MAQDLKKYSQGISAYQFAVVRILSAFVISIYFLVLFVQSVLKSDGWPYLNLLITLSGCLICLGFHRKLWAAISLLSLCALIFSNPTQYLSVDIASFIWIWCLWLLIPIGEPFSRKARSYTWKMPLHLVLFSWVLLFYLLALSLFDLLFSARGQGLEGGSSWGLLLMFLFVFDRRWLQPRQVSGDVIIFFDGVCNLCNQFVDLLIQEDQNRKIKYAPLQGQSSKSLLKGINSEELSTVIVLAGETQLQKSNAIFLVLNSLGGFWRIFTVFSFFPQSLLDFIYDRIAQNRYAIFGKQDSCRVPTEQEKTQFLD